MKLNSLCFPKKQQWSLGPDELRLVVTMVSNHIARELRLDFGLYSQLAVVAHKTTYVLVPSGLRPLRPSSHHFHLKIVSVSIRCLS